MAPGALPSGLSRDPDVERRRLTRWSLYLAPAGLVWVYAVGLVGWLLRVKNADRGGVALTDHGVAGWVGIVSMELVGIAPAVLGGWFAVRALRLGARWGAWVGLVLNAVVVALVVGGWVASIGVTA